MELTEAYDLAFQMLAERQQTPIVRYAAPVDEDLWIQCRAIFPAKPPEPRELPFHVGNLPDGVQVWLVDGDQVKLDHDADFVEAGHDLELIDRYGQSYIPKGEIWVDANLAAHDWAFNLFHEATERSLLKGGLHYDDAHRHANAAEMTVRRRALEQPARYAKDALGHGSEKRGSRPSIGTRIAGDPRRALKALNNPATSWQDLDPADLKLRVEALAKLPAKQLKRLQAEFEDGVNEEAAKLRNAEEGLAEVPDTEEMRYRRSNWQDSVKLHRDKLADFTARHEAVLQARESLGENMTDDQPARMGDLTWEEIERYAAEESVRDNARLSLYCFRGDEQLAAVPLGTVDEWERFSRWAADKGDELARLAYTGASDPFQRHGLDALRIDLEAQLPTLPEEHRDIAGAVLGVLARHPDAEGVMVSEEGGEPLPERYEATAEPPPSLADLAREFLNEP